MAMDKRIEDQVLGDWGRGDLYSYGGPNRAQGDQVTREQQDQAIAIALRMRDDERKWKRRQRR